MEINIPPPSSDVSSEGPNPQGLRPPPGNPWLFPEGNYRAVLVQVKPQHDGKARLKFEVSVPGIFAPYFAAKNYFPDLSIGSDLRQDLFTWRGHDLTPSETEAGNVDLKKLLWKHADIRVTHIFNESYDQPYVWIERISPPGTLVAPAETPAPTFNFSSGGGGRSNN